MRRIAACIGVLATTCALALAALSPASATTSSGVNDWSCRPSSAHPDPVILWHGLGSNGDTDMGFLANTLASRGYCTFYETYGTTYYGPYAGGLADMTTSASQLQGFVRQVRGTTGAAKVDIVGHSEGTTVPAYYLKFLGGGAVVDHFVGYGSNFQGTTTGGLQALADLTGIRPFLDAGGCTACNQFAPNSSFMATLNNGGVTVSGPTYTSIVSKDDEVVSPYTSGVLAAAPNVTNITLQDVCRTDFSGHVALTADSNVFALVENALDPAHATTVNCIPMPFVG